MTHPFLARLAQLDLAQPHGFVRKVAPGHYEADGPELALGELCAIEAGAGSVLAEVAGIDGSGLVLVPLESGGAVRTGGRVEPVPGGTLVGVGDGFAGRALDALGRPIDSGAPIVPAAFAPLVGAVPRPLDRTEPARLLTTGLRSIDGLLTLGEGQRIGVFAASGVGKTSLVWQLVHQIDCDRCVLCLVGERGGEVEALWRSLSAREDIERFALVAATSDESAAMRARSVNVALALAEYWRERGERVLLVVDSVTRFAMAHREIGLAAGEPPTLRAYTPNVFAALPRLVERCGAVRSGGSITAVLSVLAETDDVDDPIVEIMKSLLDGHIVLSRTLAERGHFPAIDVARSVSRHAIRLMDAEQAAAARTAVAALAAYEDARVMIESGIYKQGASSEIDRAIAIRSRLMEFLPQARGDATAFPTTVAKLRAAVAQGVPRG